MIYYEKYFKIFFFSITITYTIFVNYIYIFFLLKTFIIKYITNSYINIDCAHNVFTDVEGA